MNWFSGEISTAVQKAMKEKKVFLVFVKGDNDESKTMEDIWTDDQIIDICSEEMCVAINIAADSISGQQFSTIYPILCVPSTYLINNDGIPTDIIPGVLSKDDFLNRLQDGVNKSLQSNNGEHQTTSTGVDSNAEHETTSTGEDSNVQISSTQACIEVENDIAALTQTTLDKNAEITVEESQVTDSVNEDDAHTAKERAQLLLQESRQVKDKKEKEKVKEEERKRREEGAELSQAKRDLAERQTKELADEISKRKAEEKAAREKVREQIRQDKAEKAARFEAKKKSRLDEQEKKSAEKKVQQEQASKEKQDSNVSRLQFRLPDGSTISKQFSSDAKFLVVEAFVKEQLKGAYPSIRLTTVFPRHEFTSDDTTRTLRELGLVPNASIIVSPGRAQTVTKTSSLNPFNIIMFVLAPLLALFSWIASLFKSSNQSTSDSQQTEATSTSCNDPRTTTVRRRTGEPSSSTSGNIRSLRHDDDDENATWNGNSTQQM